MRKNRTNLFIIVSSLALIALLIIQINWVIETAKIKEALFNEKANMVLSKTTDALSANTASCRNIEDSVEEASLSDTTAQLGTEEVRILDSLFNYYLNYYNFHVDYSYVVAKPKAISTVNEKGLSNFIYNKPLPSSNNESNVEIKLLIPDKRQFIIAEMGPLFITSLLLIIIVLILFWRTVLSLIKEKNISEHTNDFLNNMTHEFKTPLTNISLAGKMILKESINQNHEKTRNYSEIILEESEKLRLQVEQVLSMTALERGEIPLYKTELDFHQLLNDSIKCLALQLENKQGSISLNLDAEKFVIMGDKTNLSNALNNLIDNAIKYSNGKPEIKIRTFNKDGQLILIVTDRGIGIDKEYHKKVFEKFFRIPTGNVHEVKGFGLGLAYIKKIIEMHEGSISLQSDKGSETIFIISLPYA